MKKKNYMWYKVKELSKNGLNKSQISFETDIDRATVRKYLSMGEEEFHAWLANPRHLPHKLSPYMQFVKKELTGQPYLSAAQIEDRLKEYFADLPDIHSKTVYNFVQTVRKKYNIEKPGNENFRSYEKLAELPYGKQAQADFGEFNMFNSIGKRVKVYFFTLVLSRSRYKFVYFQDQPFTSKTAVYSHELAFEYFLGIPREILYDQDKVFLHDENLGDYLLTHDFTAFCDTQPFKPIFCRKADPQSKGKIESVVKYVKYNFLKGRAYTNIEYLNQLVQEWLKRTANTKIHGTTRKVPAEEWEIEKTHLLPLKTTPLASLAQWQQYNVRKDNTVAYRGNFYSLPLGTYQGRETKIYLEFVDHTINFYSGEKYLLATHQLSVNKGELIRNNDHGRDKSNTIQQAHTEVLEILGGTEQSVIFLGLLKADKPRYYHDNLRAIKQGLQGTSKEIIDQAVQMCIENKIYNGNVFSEITKNISRIEKQNHPKLSIELSTNKVNTDWGPMLVTPRTSNINDYEKLF